MKSGFVSLIGRPNVGKSTLVNQIVGTKVAIISNKPQTTRNIIKGIYNDDDSQIVFIDTPGIHKPNNKLGKTLNKQAYYGMNDADIILFLVDASEELGTGDKYILEKLAEVKTPVILVLNKIDKLNNEQIFKAIDTYKDLYSFAEIVPVSALENDNIERLISVIKKYIPENVKYFNDDEVTNLSKQFMISEYVREKLFKYLKQEVPHSITCVTASYEEKENITNIGVDIIVDRDSLKKIVIGKDGSLLKTVGQESRKDIEELLGKKVYLELYVKTVDNWREKERSLREFGILDNE